MQTIRLLISGKVQGVWYRKSSSIKANELNLKGTVRNLEDGRVEMVVSGEKEDLKRLVNWCKKGPELAVVDNLEFKEMRYQRFSDFRIIQ